MFFFFLAIAQTAAAQVVVSRTGDENPVLTIAKATFWGGVTGLLLGGATALVADDNEDDIVKWFFVGGVFGGFGFGVYHVLTRDRPTTGLLNITPDGLALKLPATDLTRGAGTEPHYQVNVTLLSYRF